MTISTQGYRVIDATNATLDDSLVAKRAARDAQAFLALYERYFSRVYTYFRYRYADRQTCDDLTARTFEQALAHIVEYRPERGTFAAWLFGIARNNANGHYRQALRLRGLSWERWLSLPGSDPPPEEAAIEIDRRHLLLSCIQELAPRQRELLALKFTAGLTNRQIAEMTGLSEQNVGVILHRSIQKLRKRMERAEGRHAR